MENVYIFFVAACYLIVIFLLYPFYETWIKNIFKKMLPKNDNTTAPDIVEPINIPFSDLLTQWNIYANFSHFLLENYKKKIFSYQYGYSEYIINVVIKLEGNTERKIFEVDREKKQITIFSRYILDRNVFSSHAGKLNFIMFGAILHLKYNVPFDEIDQHIIKLLNFGYYNDEEFRKQLITHIIHLLNEQPGNEKRIEYLHTEFEKYGKQ